MGGRVQEYPGVGTNRYEMGGGEVPQGETDIWETPSSGASSSLPHEPGAEGIA